MSNIFSTLFKQLYPTGRAFKMPFASDFEKLNEAFSLSSQRLYDDANSIYDSIFPDNNNFTATDATDWERRLGMIDGSANTLTDRKAAIIRKLNAPGINPAKGHYLYIQTQLQLANFDVYIYENTAGVSPDVFFGGTFTIPVQHGGVQHGSIQTGLTLTNKLVNRIDEAGDLYFDLAGTFKLCFFVGGATAGSSANVALTRKNEFRELLLKLKPIQNIALLNINYI